MKINKNKKYKILMLAPLLITSFLLASFFVDPAFKVFADEAKGDEEAIGQLNDEIGQRRKEIDALQKEIDAYAAQIRAKQKEARGLQNQIAILDNQSAKTELDIESTEKRIDQTNLEIQALNIRIKTIEKEIEVQKDKVAEFLRLIDKTDQVSYLEVLLVNDSFSDFFDQIKYINDIHSDLKGNVEDLKSLTFDLEIEKGNWEAKRDIEEELKNELQEHKNELTENSVAKEFLLYQTKLTEQEYKNYSSQLQLEQQKINSDILSLEKEVRKKLEAREEQEKFSGFGPARLGWPVDPSRGITAFFHDPSYPFRYIFEHPAIDIRASQGTPIQAPESGYVARVKFAGDKSYAYVMILHNDGLSSVFGHVSAVYVSEDEYVTKGQVVAATGGAPGTIGAGNLSTGAHLHYEVRLNGIPVNPLEYLPGGY